MDHEFRATSIAMLDFCQHVFANYVITDDFIYTNEYDNLYRELTDCIKAWLEEDNFKC